MNIFVTSSCPVESAVSLDNKRLIKMVLETAQLLSAAVNLSAGDKVAIYKTSHKGHPCTLWAKQSRGNFNWLMAHGYALGEEYTSRYDKQHKSVLAIKDIEDRNLIEHIPDGPQTPFANCAANVSLGVCFKHVKDVHQAYRQYLAIRWSNDKRHPTWTNRQAPSWINYYQSTGIFRVAEETILIFD